MNIEQTFQLALRHHQSGRMAEAEALYRQILAADSRHAGALHFLGIIAHQVGRNDAAESLIRQAIASNPNLPDAFSNLGTVLKELGRLDEAIATYGQAIALKPNYAEAHYNLSNALRENGRLDEAIAACRQAISLNPKYPDAVVNLGNLLKTKGQLHEAIATFRQAIALQPADIKAYSNLGNALCDKGQLDEAIAVHRQAIALKPDYPEAHYNLGTALNEKGELDQAVATYSQAIALKPDYPGAHYNRAHALLKLGDLAAGFAEYEWRWKCADFAGARRHFTQPQWDGGPLEGRTILLHAEQGFGDAIQFIRYLPLVARCGGKIIIECHPELQRLLQTAAADSPVVATGHTLPAFDLHCPFLSLPRLFGTNLTNIPKDVPYLHANAADVEVWRKRLADQSASLKVGLAWAGRPTHQNDRNRSLKLGTFAPLAQLAGVRFVSLQKGEAAAEAKSPPEGMELLDAGPELKDFADTAALVAALDLVIAVDTSVVHLAGALGKPVWVLLPFAPDWRWLLNRDDSPWYPTMRLIRQQRRMEWEPVVASIREELNALAETGQRNLPG
jgi:tetratricopeptide (TPR) repeat protein